MFGKIIGAMLIIGSCGWVGLSITTDYRREETNLRHLLSIVDFIQCELQYRMTPLPQLCLSAGAYQKNQVGKLLCDLGQMLEQQRCDDVAVCVERMLSSAPIPQLTAAGIRQLGQTLGRFDLEGQIRELGSVRDYCRRELARLGEHRESRLRSYQTLSLCAGAALAILFV